MNYTEIIISELIALSEPDKKETLQRFFKTEKGQYGEGDKFLGVTVPNIRKVAYRYSGVKLEDLEKLLSSPWHEIRMCGLLIMVEHIVKINKNKWLKTHSLKDAEAINKDYFEFYLSHTERINNWDLVDLTAPTIIGKYIIDKDRSIIYQLADSQLIWDQRISIVSTFAFIRTGDLEDTFKISEKLLHNTHDLIHKAVGWMLREAGKRNNQKLIAFLDKFALEMPRTMLRYSIEKLEEVQRKHYLELK